MAGINFELKKLYSNKNTITDDIKANFFSAFTIAGSCLISMICLYFMESISKKNFNDAELVIIFPSVVGFIFIFSYIISSPWQFFLNRYIADCIYEKKQYKIKSSLIGALKINGLISYILGTSLIMYSSLPKFLKIYIVILFILITSIFIINIYLTLLKEYVEFIKTYLISGIVSIGLTYALFNFKFLSYFEFFEPTILFISYLVGALIIFFRLSSLLGRKLTGKIEKEYEFLNYLSRDKKLIFSSFLLTIGLFGHIILHFYFGDHLEVLKIFRTTQYYSMAFIISCLLIIPSLIYFIVIFEPEFYIHTKKYVSLIKDNFGAEIIKKQRENIGRYVMSSFNYMFELQFFISLTFIMVIKDLGAFVGISFDVEILKLLKILVLGMLCNVMLMSYITVFLYFNKMAIVLKIAIIYGILPSVLEFLAILLGKEYYGVGFLIGNIITAIYANSIFNYSIKYLSYEIFYHENFAIAKPSKIILKIKNGLYSKREFYIILIIMLFSLYNK